MIENLDKFEIAEKIDELKKLFSNPDDSLANLAKRFGVYDEIMDMPTDKDGGIPRYYISESLNSFFQISEDIKNEKECDKKPIDDIITDDFFGTLFTKRYGKQ